MMEKDMSNNITETCKYTPLFPFAPSEGFCQWLDSISKTSTNKQKESEE